MHDHLKIIGIIIILFAGIGNISYVRNIKNKYQDYSLKWLLFYITFYNLAVLTVLLRKYIDVNLSSLIKTPFSVSELITDLEIIFNVLRLASFILFFESLRENNVYKLIKNSTLVVITIISVLILIKYCFYNINSLYSAISQFFYYFSQVIFYYEPLLLLLLFFSNYKNETSIEKKVNISFSILFMGRYLFFLIFYVIPINVFGFYNVYLQTFLIFSSILTFNIMPYIWIKYFFVKFQESAPKITEHENIIALEDYNISSREKEIIGLILQGKSNKEIETELFLSPHTVKNHIYHIYKKMNITSRFQLIKLLNSGIEKL